MNSISGTLTVDNTVKIWVSRAEIDIARQDRTSADEALERWAEAGRDVVRIQSTLSEVRAQAKAAAGTFFAAKRRKAQAEKKAQAATSATPVNPADVKAALRGRDRAEAQLRAAKKAHFDMVRLVEKVERQEKKACELRDRISVLALNAASDQIENGYRNMKYVDAAELQKGATLLSDMVTGVLRATATAA